MHNEDGISKKLSVAEETKTAWNTDKEQRYIDQFLKVYPDWAQTLTELGGIILETEQMKEEPSTAATGKDAESVILEGSSGGIITENRLSIKVNGAPVGVADKRAGTVADHVIVALFYAACPFSLPADVQLLSRRP